MRRKRAEVSTELEVIGPNRLEDQLDIICIYLRPRAIYAFSGLAETRTSPVVKPSSWLLCMTLKSRATVLKKIIHTTTDYSPSPQSAWWEMWRHWKKWRHLIWVTKGFKNLRETKISHTVFQQVAWCGMVYVCFIRGACATYITWYNWYD